MPPHCDSMDGPVVKAATRALDQGDVKLILSYVPQEGEAEVAEAFARARGVRGVSAEAREVADRYFFEIAVRVHRAGEGAPYTGLKPAGLDHGPVIPVAERALESHSPDELAGMLTRLVDDQVRSRLGQAVALEPHVGEGVAQAREYVEAMLGLQVWAHSLYLTAIGPAHAGELESAHEGAHAHHAGAPARDRGKGMTNRSRNVVQQELAEARGDLSRLQTTGASNDPPSADARAALERVIALQKELDGLSD